MKCNKCCGRVYILATAITKVSFCCFPLKGKCLHVYFINIFYSSGIKISGTLPNNLVQHVWHCKLCDCAVLSPSQCCLWRRFAGNTTVSLTVSRLDLHSFSEQGDALSSPNLPPPKQQPSSQWGILLGPSRVFNRLLTGWACKIKPVDVGLLEDWPVSKCHVIFSLGVF